MAEPNPGTYSKALIEYSVGGRGRTPFEAFLAHSDEKERCAGVTAGIMRRFLPPTGGSVLDLGSGTGDYTRLIHQSLQPLSGIQCTLVEPSLDLLPSLRRNAAVLRESSQATVVPATFEQFAAEAPGQHDVVLASNLYHIPREEYPSQLDGMLDLASGALLFLHRDPEGDDVYDFKRTFKSRLRQSEEYDPKTIRTVTDAVAQLPSAQVAVEHAFSEVHFPLEDRETTIAMIEFLLTCPWDSIDPAMQREIFAYIHGKDGRFKQHEGIAVITRQE